MSEDNCGGQCCERFIIGKDLEDIKREYLNWKEDCEGTPMVMNGGEGKLKSTFYSQDIYLIYPMLIDLGEHYFEPYAPEVKTDFKVRHYGCKHFDPRTRLCTIYDIRPSMCRNYPNGRVCHFKGCKCYPQKLEAVGELYEREPKKLIRTGELLDQEEGHVDQAIRTHIVQAIEERIKKLEEKE
jgi:Fe-S-cluster containining protein